MQQKISHLILNYYMFTYCNMKQVLFYTAILITERHQKHLCNAQSHSRGFFSWLVFFLFFFLHSQLSKGSTMKSRQQKILLFLHTITFENTFSCQIFNPSLFCISLEPFWPPQFSLKNTHFRKNYIDIIRQIVHT